jgi:hypothetical protein
MEDKLHEALEYVYDVAEEHHMIIHWQVPDCDPDGNSVLIENSYGAIGLIYYNPGNPVDDLHFYLLDVELYQWALAEGFSDADIFEEGEFHVLDKVELSEFCNILCKFKHKDGKNKKDVK